MSARDVIVTAASDCPKVFIRGDVYELADDILAALSAAGFVIVSLDRLKPVVAEAYVQGVLGCPADGYRPGTANAIESGAKAYATRIMEQIKGRKTDDT